MTWVLLILAACLFLAYANGANDNFKGVATLFGSGTTSYRLALSWAALSTFAGSIAAAFFAMRLAQVFSGKGLVPDALIASPEFLTAVLLGAALTVFAATLIGVPISTTHGLTGALTGAGLMALGSGIDFSTLGKNFIYPLAFSPLIAVALAGGLYAVLSGLRRRAGIGKETCVCVGGKQTLHCAAGAPVAAATGALACGATTEGAGIQPAWGVDVIVDEQHNCDLAAIEVYQGRLLGVSIQKVIDTLHWISAGAVSFARGLNDAPKIAGVALAAGALNLHWLTFLVAGAMALGGVLQVRKVALTMSREITPLNHGQGFTANLVTSLLVLFASRWGLPVSTTHVSCGALFGIGIVNGRAHWKTIGGILLAWLLTLPIAAIFAALVYLALTVI